MAGTSTSGAFDASVPAVQFDSLRRGRVELARPPVTSSDAATCSLRQLLAKVLLVRQGERSCPVSEDPSRVIAKVLVPYRTNTRCNVRQLTRHAI